MCFYVNFQSTILILLYSWSEASQAGVRKQAFSRLSLYNSEIEVPRESECTNDFKNSEYYYLWLFCTVVSNCFNGETIVSVIT